MTALHQTVFKCSPRGKRRFYEETGLVVFEREERSKGSNPQLFLPGLLCFHSLQSLYKGHLFTLQKTISFHVIILKDHLVFFFSGTPAGCWWLQSPKACNSASFHQLAWFWSAFHTYWNAQVPKESEIIESYACRANCGSLQVCIMYTCAHQSLEGLFWEGS